MNLQRQFGRPPHASAARGPFFIVLNAGSGSDDARAVREAIEHAFLDAGRQHTLLLVDQPDRLSEQARRAVFQARATNGVVVAAGGDGTINTVAAAALEHGLPFGVIPQGTFNYFSRTHGIPADVEEAVQVLVHAPPQPVQVGVVNEHLFLVNASLGLYPQLLEDREAYKQQFGRSRLVALFAALATIVREHRPLRIRLESNGRTVTLRTPTLFVGNNRLQLEQIGIPQASVVEQGWLAALALKPVHTHTLLWLMLRGALGQLGGANQVTGFATRTLTVRPLSLGLRRIKVATDGETIWLKPPIEFRVADKPLMLIKPLPAQP